MESKGIRIWDAIDDIVSVTLSDILIEILNGNLFYWSILYLDVIGNLGKNISNHEFQEQILESERGLFIKWDQIQVLADKCDQIVDIILIGSKDKSSLKRYDTDEEMYESCDIVIEMNDSSYWVIFSKDEKLIKKLVNKFTNVEFI